MSSLPDKINNDDLKTFTSKCYEPNKTNKSISLSLFHINACSLNKNFDNLQHILSCTNENFDIIAIAKTRTTKKFL